MLQSIVVKILAFVLVYFHLNPVHAAAKNGVMDLGAAAWQDSVKLEGEWLFHPNVFLQDAELDSERFSKESGLKVPIPGGIRDILNVKGQPLGDNVWGTLVLELRNVNPPFEHLGLHLRGDTAYHVFVKDLDHQGPMRSLVRVGKPSPNREDSIPQIASPLGLWTAQGSGNYLLIVHISGYYYTDTNLWTTPRLGAYENLKQELDLIFLMDAFVAGAMFIMLLYYLSLFFHRREDKAALLLGVWSCAIFLRHFGCSPSLQQVIFPESSLFLFSLMRTMEYGLLGIMGGTATWFAIESFEFHKIRLLGKIETALGVAVLLFCVLTSPDVYPKYIVWINLILFVQVISYLCVSAWSMKIKAKGSLYLTIGGAVIAMTTINDMTIGLGLRSSSLFLSPLGMTFLVFANGQVVAKLFARAFRTAQRLSVALQEEVEQKTRRIRSMLDNIPQGVVSFVPPGIAESEYSKQLEIILESDAIAERSISSLLLSHSSLSSDEKDRIMSTLLASLDDDVLNFELNASQLPTEMEFHKDDKQKSLQVSWAPIVNSQGIVKSIQVTLNDVTRLRRVEQESQEQKEELGFIQEILHINVENFRIFVDSSTHLLMENTRLIHCNEQGLSEVVKIMFINLHTIKGSARTLGLRKITTIVHDVEQGYVQLLKNTDEGWNQTFLLQQIESIKDMLNHYEHVFHDVLGHQKNKMDEVGVSREFLEQHCHLLSKLSMSIEQPALHAKIISSLRILEEEIFQDAAEFLQDFLEPAERVARDLGKEHPLILVDADDFILSHDAKNALGKAIVHVLRNAMDHGIETAKERMEKGKAPFGCIKFQLEERDQSICISIEDDGRGLALHDLQEKSKSMGLRQLSSPQELADLVFQPGLSTAKNVTEISGRGMGMDAMRKFIRDVGGDVQIKVEDSRAGKDFVPFKILIFLPSQFYRRKKTDVDQLAAS